MQHFVVDQAYGPKVRFGRVFPFLQYLRRHVERSSHDRLHDCLFTVQTLSEAKVTQLANSIFEQNVSRLKISMNDAIFMQILGSIHDILQILLGFLLRYPLPFLQQLEEISILAKLGHNVHIIGSLIDVVQFDNILMADLLHNINLRLDILDVVGIGEYLFVDDLDCNWLGGLYLLAQVDHGVGALTEELLEIELIFLDLLLALHYLLYFQRILPLNKYQRYVFYCMKIIALSHEPKLILP